MAVITLGSNNQTIGYETPIVIPIDDFAISGITILNNPLLLNQSSGSGSSDSFWLRNTGNGILSPATNSDSVVINGSVIRSTEKLRVFGAILAQEYRFADTTNITENDTELVFADPVAGSYTLSELASGSNLQAANVAIVDTEGYYASDKVEGALAEIAVNFTESLHTHNNFTLLETYDQTNADISDAITNQHVPVTLSTVALTTGLSLTDQELEFQFATVSIPGALSAVDFATFNDKLDTTDTIEAIKSLTLTSGDLIVATSSTSAKVLNLGTANQYLRVNSGGDDIEYSDGTISTQFVVPNGFGSIVNQIGDINNTVYSTLSDLNSESLLSVIQQMLFPIASVGIDADRLTGKTASGTMDGSTSSYADPGTSDNIVAHIDYIYALITSIAGGRTWLDPVATFLALDATYPSASVGDSALVTDVNFIYTYNGSTWVKTSAEIPLLTNLIDGIISHTWYTDLEDFVTNTTDYFNQNVFGIVSIYNNGILVDSYTAINTRDEFQLNGGTNITLSLDGNQITIDSSAGSSNTFENGIYDDSTIVRLGGSLTEPTTITGTIAEPLTLSVHTLNLENTALNLISGVPALYDSTFIELDFDDDNYLINKKYADSIVYETLFNEYRYYRQTKGTNTANDVRVYVNATGYYIQRYTGTIWETKQDLIF